MSFQERLRPRERDEIVLEALQEQSDKLDRIFTLLSTITLTELKITMNIQEIQAKADNVLQKVQQDTDAANAVKTLVYHQNDLLSSLQGQIKELQNSNDPAALDKLAATIDAIKAAETANADSVAAAVTAGTPSDPSLPAAPGQPAPNQLPGGQQTTGAAPIVEGSANPTDAAQRPDAAKPINQPEPPPT